MSFYKQYVSELSKGIISCLEAGWYSNAREAVHGLLRVIDDAEQLSNKVNYNQLDGINMIAIWED